MKDRVIRDILAKAGLEPTPQIMRVLRTEKSTISIPNKVLAKFQYVPLKEWKVIHEDIETAKELTLMIVSCLAGAYNKAQNTNDKRAKMGYKRLYSPILAALVKYDRDTASPYRKCLDLLIKHGVIERGTVGCIDSGKATEYRLTKNYYGKGCEKYELKTNTVKRMRNKEFNSNFERAVKTNIGKNHLKMRAKVQFPSDKEVDQALEFAVKTKYTNRKGKRLVKLGKRKRTEELEAKYVFAEDYKAQFEYLRDHMTVPVVKEEYLDDDGKLVFRIATCFNLMPSLLRGLIRVDGEKLHENDFSTLHPNIAQMIYGGDNKEPITHDKVAQELYGVKPGETGYKEKRQEVKIEHLSFFNKRVEDMRRSPLWEYYDKKEPLMMARIIQEKEDEGHEYTSKRLFAVETMIMEETIKRLNKLGVDVIYVYDALYSVKSEKPTVQKVMNEVAELYSVHTRVG